MVNACIRAHAQQGHCAPEQLKVAIIGAGRLASNRRRTASNDARGIAYGLDRVDPDKDIKVTVTRRPIAFCPRCRNDCPPPARICCDATAWRC